jgi:hypothetical protein
MNGISAIKSTITAKGRIIQPFGSAAKARQNGNMGGERFAASGTPAQAKSLRVSLPVFLDFSARFPPNLPFGSGYSWALCW